MLAAPIIVIPEDPFSKDNASGLTINLGVIRMSSAVQRKSQEISYKTITDLSKLYDCYELRLDKIQVYIFDSGKQGQLWNKYIRNLNAQFKFYNCLEPSRPDLPMFKIGGIFNAVDIVITDFKLDYLLNILKGFHKGKETLNTAMKNIQKNIKKEKTKELETTSKATKEIDKKESTEAKDKNDDNTKLVASVKKEEDKENTIKKLAEVMIHIDDINITIGKVIASTDNNYTLHYNFLIQNKIIETHEVAFLPDIRMGMNGINVRGHMGTDGHVKGELHVFRIYSRDLQCFLSENKLKKVVAERFKYIVYNPDIELLTKHRLGDNYSAFKNNNDFFHNVQTSNFFKETINQLDITLNIAIQGMKGNLIVNLNELHITLPYQVFVPPLYLLHKCADGLRQLGNIIGIDQELGLPFDIDVQADIKGFQIILPTDVLFPNKHSAIHYMS